MLNYNPIPIRAWEFIEPGTLIRDTIAKPQQFARVLLENGKVLIIKRHPTVHIKNGTARLYAAEGESLCFFSLSERGLNEIKPCWSEAWSQKKNGSKYPRLRHFRDADCRSGILCHHAVYEIWYGLRRPGYEIHHLNRDKFDWCENNLIELKKAIEHPNADARQKLIESAVGDLHRLSHARLRELTLMPNNEFLHELQKLRAL